MSMSTAANVTAFTSLYSINNILSAMQGTRTARIPTPGISIALVPTSVSTL
jgi:hypothetical protein